MKALVLVNGDLSRRDIICKRVRTVGFDFVVAADRGARHASTVGVRLDAIVGDMDSLSQKGQKEFEGAEVVAYPAEKNETDLELALLYARDRGADTIVMIGVIGGRLDMTVSNVLLLTNAKLRQCRIEIWHGNETAWIVKPPGGEINGNIGDTVSLIPLVGTASGITNSGFKYPLINTFLTQGSPRGVSNVIQSLPARIKLKKGLLLAVHTPGKA